MIWNWCGCSRREPHQRCGMCTDEILAQKPGEDQARICQGHGEDVRAVLAVEWCWLAGLLELENFLWFRAWRR